jgi:hypothetical protein
LDQIPDLVSLFLQGGGHAVQAEPSSSTQSVMDLDMLSGSTRGV